MKTYKYILPATVLAFVVLTVFSGCKKFLDTPRQGAYTADNYPYPGGSGPYDQFVFAAYDDLRNYWISADGLVTTTSIRSDDADKGDSPSGGAIEMDDFTVLPASGRVNLIWTSYYGMIEKCNSAIARIDTTQNITATDEIKLQSKAEVRFLRAYAYFMLVRLYARVPIIDTVYADVASRPITPQSTPAQIYPFIEADLTFAAQYLPLSWDSKFAGRLTRGAANGLLAKLYLTQHKWPQAAAAAELVINSGQYDLSTPYTLIFREEGENSKESVFEAQATATPSIPTGNGVQYTSIQGVRGSGAWDLGWGWNTPSASLDAAYEAGDPRKARTILYASTATTPGMTIYGEVMPIYPSQLPYQRYNHKVLASPSLRNTITRFGWWMNVRLLRYADVILMYAEAANEAGNSAGALTALNSVRARARQGAAAGVLPDVSTTDQALLRDAIRHERRVELAMEHDRFFDLVRWGIAAQTMQAAGKTNFVAGKHELLPIPQAQIDLTPAGNKYTQNPGY